MNEVYGMWSSRISPAVRVSAARSSILPVSSRGLLPGAILKLLRRRERSDLPQVFDGRTTQGERPTLPSARYTYVGLSYHSWS